MIQRDCGNRKIYRICEIYTADITALISISFCEFPFWNILNQFSWKKFSNDWEVHDHFCKDLCSLTKKGLERY